MTIRLSKQERVEILKAWKNGEFDTSKIKKLENLDKLFKPLSVEEAKRIIKNLDN